MDIAIIGGGAAGMFAAISAAENQNCTVFVFEKNKDVLKKILITGKGRCNVTNDCTVREFIENVSENGRFLFSALNNFDPSATKEFFENEGVRLKTERGKRVFPVSDKASDIKDALKRKAASFKNIRFIFEEVKNVSKNEKFLVNGRNFDKVIIATGGRSYPGTGSTGDGYRFARFFGHTVKEISPSLVPLLSNDSFVKQLMGLSLKNVRLKVENKKNGKIVFEDFGELLFTHFGISGPLVLSASAHLKKADFPYIFHIDLKPAIDEKQLDARILRDFEEFKNKDFLNSLSKLYPKTLIAVMVALSGIDPRKKVNEISKEERRRLLTYTKDFCVSVTGFRSIDEAVITRGGVDTKEIDPKTMQSKFVKGLYFAGEVIDVDAYTGGFNLQIAFSTGKLAGTSAANE